MLSCTLSSFAEFWIATNDARSKQRNAPYITIHSRVFQLIEAIRRDQTFTLRVYGVILFGVCSIHLQQLDDVLKGAQSSSERGAEYARYSAQRRVSSKKKNRRAVPELQIAEYELNSLPSLPDFRVQDLNVNKISAPSAAEELNDFFCELNAVPELPISNVLGISKTIHKRRRLDTAQYGNDIIITDCMSTVSNLVSIPCWRPLEPRFLACRGQYLQAFQAKCWYHGQKTSELIETDIDILRGYDEIDDLEIDQPMPEFNIAVKTAPARHKMKEAIESHLQKVGNRPTGVSGLIGTVSKISACHYFLEILSLARMGSISFAGNPGQFGGWKIYSFAY